MSSRTAAEHAARQRRSTAGAFIGTAIEWYDFYIFGTAAALVFSQVFYPTIATGAALLASFATFWVGFLARPVGGLVFGHLGDRLGRKNILVTTLLAMGIATTLIGVLPGFTTIGIAAPILLVLLRGVQGFAVGGEWGGAVLMATENATEKKKGMAGAWVQQGAPAGAILATVIFIVVGSLPDEQFLSWGWRIPFLFSAVLVIVGLIIRLKVEETEVFLHTKTTQQIVKLPVVRVLRTAPGSVLLGVAASAIGIALAYFINTFLLAWTTTEVGMDRQVMLDVLLGGAILQFIWQPLAAKIAERIGAQQVMVGGLVLSVLLTAPFFLAIVSGSVLFLVIMLYLMTMTGGAYYAMLATFLASSFPANVRYSGVSVAYQLCATLVGGSTPLFAQWILNNSEGPWGVAAFYAALLVITIGGVWGLGKKVQRRDVGQAHRVDSQNAS